LKTGEWGIGGVVVLIVSAPNLPSRADTTPAEQDEKMSKHKVVNNKKAVAAAFIVRPSVLEMWVHDRNPAVNWFVDGADNWRAEQKRLGMSLCLNCEHEFTPTDPLPPAFFLFVGEVFLGGLSEKDCKITVGICERCAANDDETLLQNGLLGLQKYMPELHDYLEGIGRAVPWRKVRH